MLRPREQIHRLHLFRAVPLCLQPLGVPGGGGRVAADIDHPLGIHLDNSRKGGFIAAFAGRVEDDDVRVEALGGELGREVAGRKGISCGKSAAGRSVSEDEACRSDSFATKRNLVEIIRFTLFSRHVVFDGEGDKLRNKRIENHITVSVVIDMECGNTKN